MEKKVFHRTLSSIDLLILVLLIGVALIDTVNGILVTNNLFSISKPYKFFILLLMILKLMIHFKINRYSLLIIFSFLSFFFGYAIYFVRDTSIYLFTQNFVESIKYFIWPISFLYFRSLFLSKNKRVVNYIFKIIDVSYLILLFNIIIGFLGFGYEFYPKYHTGMKGFFFSGNEFSLLFILLTFIKAWRYYVFDSRKYYFFILFSLFLGFNIGSKTTILGIIGFFLIILISNIKIDFSKISSRKMIIGIVGFISLPFLIWFFISINQDYINNFIIRRLESYNYDLLTWFLSKRNLVASDGLIGFEGLDGFSKFFGQGETSFQSNYQMVELDFIDLLLNHGYLGVLLYGFLILSIIRTILKKYRESSFYKSLFYFYIMIIIILSNLSGHIINTGVPGFFIGMIFAMIYISKKQLINNRLL